MEKYSIIKSIYLALLCFTIFSCETPDLEKGVTYNKGLLNFYLKIPGESNEYGAAIAGPYKDGDTLFIKVPTSEEAPLDLTNLKPYASLENNSYVSPAIEGIMDFSSPVEIKVTDGLGVQRTHYIKVLPTPPKTRFNKMWFKNSIELGLKFPYISGIAVSGDNLFIHDADIWNAGGVGVRVFDRITAEQKATINSPTTFTMQVKTDDAGHIVINRYNEYGAGFILYLYETINSTPKEIINFTVGEGCPYALGSRMSVTGNLLEGKAFVYATAPDTREFYYWEFNNGVPLKKMPTIVKYPSAKESWSFASVKRESIADDSEHFITYCIYDGNDSEDQKKGSRFEIFPMDMDLVQMNQKNNLYKILGFDVFTINGDKFLATLEQGFWAWDGVVLKVFEITNKNNLSLIPDDPEYKKFSLLESDVYGEVNYNRWGDVSVKVDGNNAFIYTSIACGAPDKSGILAYKMTYLPQ